MVNIFKLIRVKQWVKNFFIFLPIFFALKVSDTQLLIKTGITFISFSLVSSAVYILNDLKDKVRDQHHPVKKLRPIASGAITEKTATALLLLSLFAGAGISTVVSTKLTLILSIYFVLNILYTFRLKNIAPLDIFIIATGFLLRLTAGTDFAGITGVEPSRWIIVMTFLLALFLAFAKRRDDVMLSAQGRDVRKSISGYNLEFINSSMSVMSAVIIVAYLLYTLSPEVTSHFKSNNVYLTVIFVILGIFRYLQLTFVYNRSGNPTELLLRDRFLQLTILGWIIFFTLLAY
jgi:decaprenyl-phosphate phosphoribosyltransferase